MNQCVAYLAGKIGGRSYDEVMKERKHAAELLRGIGIHVLCPMRGKEPLFQQTRIDMDGDPVGFRNEELRARDLADVLRSDILIILMGDTPSWGTGIEWGIAHDNDIPVFVVATDVVRMQRGFVGACCAKAFPTIEQ